MDVRLAGFLEADSAAAVQFTADVPL